jgi:hypothetical protein
MLNPKIYLRILFIFLLLIGVLAAGYVYDFSKQFPPPITNRISFDAKLKFIREHIDPDKIDTIIVGSSVGLNNVLGAVLEKGSHKVQHVLNLSVYEATTLEVEQILELSDAFPNLKRIIYSAQYSDFPHAKKYENYKPEILKKFIRKELSSIALSKLLFDACNNLLFCKQREKKWKKEHLQSDKFTSLLFDHTGSVPLEIYKKEAVGGRWYLPHPGIMHGESFNAVERMAKRAQKQGIKYYVVHQPYRDTLVKKHESVGNALKYFDDKINAIIKKYNGRLICLQNLHLSDEYHADRTHLNVKGSTIVSIEIGKIIDQEEK